MTYLTHVTITTGDIRRSPRYEVAEDALTAVALWLNDALLLETPAALFVPGYTAQAQTSPGALVVTVYGPDKDPIATFGVARRSRSATALWGILCDLASVPPSAPPPAPWIAVVLLPALSEDKFAAGWLGDMERCVAWAWIERVAD